MNKSIILELVTGGENYFDSVNLTENEITENALKRCITCLKNFARKYPKKIRTK